MGYVYKSNGDYIVTLERLQDTIHNENRQHVVNKHFALHRANKLKVVAIEHKYICGKTLQEMYYTLHSKFIPNLYSLYPNNFQKPEKVLFKVGEIIQCENFCSQLEIDWAPGIQYYIEKQVAIDIEQSELTNGSVTIYLPDGRFDCTMYLKHGLLHREEDLPAVESWWYKAWYKNGDRWRDDENAPMIVYFNKKGSFGNLTRKEYETEHSQIQ